MGFAIAAANAALKLISTSGALTSLTLPSGVVVSTTERTRFAILARTIIAVNGPSRALAIEPTGLVYPVGLAAPVHAPTLAAGAAGSLIGAYLVKSTFLIKDELGNIVAESDFSPVSNSVTLASQLLAVTNIAISGDPAVTSRRLYRTAAGGSVFFEWVDIDDNTTTSLTDGAGDGALTISPPDDLGAIPVGAQLIAAWKNRLWVKSRLQPDRVSFSADGLIYSFPEDFALDIRPVGQDEAGITAFMARRDELGVGKRDMIAKIVGDDDTDFAVVTVVMGVGPVSQESVVIDSDIAYFLGEDGVYTWDGHGVQSVSDETVRTWFTSDVYFNRAEFDQAVAHYDPYLNAYVLGLCAAGTSVINRWVFFTLQDKKWWGPHKTDLSGLSFGAMTTLEDANDLAMPVFGASDGHIYKYNPAVFTDGASTAIDFDVDTKFFSKDAPDIMHNWGMPSILTKIQASGTLSITPRVGGLDAAAQTAISHDLTLGRQRVRRLGAGRLTQLNLRQATNAIGCQIYGIELPVVEIGRR
jgi:hypothetical protein